MVIAGRGNGRGESGGPACEMGAANKGNPAMRSGCRWTAVASGHPVGMVAGMTGCVMDEVCSSATHLKTLGLDVGHISGDGHGGAECSAEVCRVGDPCGGGESACR